MKVIKNTLEPFVETWDDPGDYPSNAGSGPLPSYSFLAGMEGEVQIEMTDEELAAYGECQDEFIEQLDIDLPSGILSAKWEHELKGNVLTLTAVDAEGDPDYDPNPEPEYYPEDYERRGGILRRIRDDEEN